MEDTFGIFEETFFLALGDVAMPGPNGDIGVLEEVVEAIELVVDEGFDGADVEGADGAGRIIVELSEDGKEGGFGFAGSGTSGDQEVGVGVKNDVAGGDLNGAQVGPALGKDEVLDERGEAVKWVRHEPNFTTWTFGWPVSIPERVSEWLCRASSLEHL